MCGLWQSSETILIIIIIIIMVAFKYIYCVAMDATRIVEIEIMESEFAALTVSTGAGAVVVLGS